MTIDSSNYIENIYSKLEDKSRLGVVNLSLTLSNILLNKIREYIPDISCEVNNRLVELGNRFSHYLYTQNQQI